MEPFQQISPRPPLKPVRLLRTEYQFFVEELSDADLESVFGSWEAGEDAQEYAAAVEGREADECDQGAAGNMLADREIAHEAAEVLLSFYLGGPQAGMFTTTMDSRPGTCWRCGGVAVLSCPRCELARYCGEHCMQVDVFRHEVECTNCAVTQPCSLPSCGMSTREARPCSACQEVYYCSPACQRSDWPRHKGACLQQTRYIRQAATTIAARLAADKKKKKDAGLSTTYYWGNTVAVDLLQLSQNECSHGNDHHGDDFNLLLLGTGSMRHVVLTAAELSKEFPGNVTFILNDNDFQVMARNVLMLYVLWRYGDKEDVAMDVTQIWYSLLISKEQTEMLRICLEDLLDVEYDGDEVIFLCTGLITIRSGHFTTLKKMWKTWLKLLNETGETKKSIKKEFQAIYWKRLRGFPKEPRMGVESHLLRLPERHRASVRDWYENGILLSERDHRRERAGNDNVTLMSSNTRLANFFTKIANAMNGSSKVPHTMPYPELTLGLQSDSTPFGAWDCLSVKDFSDDDCALRMYSTYISDKILRFQKTIKEGKIKVMFVLSDCLEVSQHIPEGMVFDRIHTSNLADYVGYPALLQFAKPLLRKTNQYAVAITEFMNWVRTVPERATLGQTDAAVFIPSERLTEKLEDAARKDIAALRGGMTKELDVDLTTVLHVLRGRKILMEYFDNWVAFMWYLRAELLARTSTSSALDIDTNGISRPGGCAKVPKMTEVSTACGMKLRNFSKAMNKICSFKPRVNAKPISDPNVHLRVLEWKL
ncbi:MSS51 [Branchiostoma lanceolatum]|uniref:MSS51 protein n=1 Tax=Branchiostoma lanceolatum TaxID=7740 RepID=A0A8K0A491_BRALA|nr:MSS51 [Branchiostoma lanceolatum]